MNAKSVISFLSPIFIAFFISLTLFCVSETAYAAADLPIPPFICGEDGHITPTLKFEGEVVHDATVSMTVTGSWNTLYVNGSGGVVSAPEGCSLDTAVDSASCGDPGVPVTTTGPFRFVVPSWHVTDQQWFVAQAQYWENGVFRGSCTVEKFFDIPSARPWLVLDESISQTAHLGEAVTLDLRIRNLDPTTTTAEMVVEEVGGKSCFSGLPAKVKLGSDEMQNLSISADTACTGLGVYTGTVRLFEFLPISVDTPRTASVPITLTVLPSLWEVVVNSPIKAESLQPVTYTLTVTNTGDIEMVGSAVISVKNAPFVPGSIQYFIRAGQVTSTTVGTETHGHWVVPVPPGESRSIKIVGITQEVGAIIPYSHAWDSTGPDGVQRSRDLIVHPLEVGELGSTIYLPVVSR